MFIEEERDWVEFLSQHLTFPFKAIVDEVSEQEFFGIGDTAPIR